MKQKQPLDHRAISAKGGSNSRKNMAPEKASELARKAVQSRRDRKGKNK